MTVYTWFGPAMLVAGFIWAFASKSRSDKQWEEWDAQRKDGEGSFFPEANDLNNNPPGLWYNRKK